MSSEDEEQQKPDDTLDDEEKEIVEMASAKKKSFGNASPSPVKVSTVSNISAKQVLRMMDGMADDSLIDLGMGLFARFEDDEARAELIGQIMERYCVQGSPRPCSHEDCEDDEDDEDEEDEDPDGEYDDDEEDETPDGEYDDEEGTS